MLTGIVAVAQGPPYHNHYVVGMDENQKITGSSHIYHLDIDVYADGAVRVGQTLTNGVVNSGWCGTYILKLNEVGTRDTFYFRRNQVSTALARRIWTATRAKVRLESG
jgi:hypothetical protein